MGLASLVSMVCFTRFVWPRSFLFWENTPLVFEEQPVDYPLLVFSLYPLYTTFIQSSARCSGSGAIGP